MSVTPPVGLMLVLSAALNVYLLFAVLRHKASARKAWRALSYLVIDGTVDNADVSRAVGKAPNERELRRAAKQSLRGEIK